MSNKHASPPRRGGRKYAREARSSRKNGRIGAILGWSFLGAAILLALVAVIRLLPDAAMDKQTAPAPTATVDPGPAGSAFVLEGSEPTAAPGTAQSGRSVSIRSLQSDFQAPDSVTFGILRTADLYGLGEKLAENAAASGWGETVWEQTDNGSLLLRAKELTPLGAADFQRQADFLKTAQPENLARTFLDNCGLIPMLRSYGLYLSTDLENNNGEITFRGAGDAAGAECTVRLTFLYTGAFDQMVVRAVSLADAVTTADVVSVKKAMGRAVSWTAGSGEVTALSAELRHVRGLPFYVFRCDDGTAAYALAVDEDALAQVPGAPELYRQLLSEGIQDNATPSGGE